MSRQLLNPYKRHTSPPSRPYLYESRSPPSSHFNPATDHNTSACGVRITTDYVAGSFCEPQTAKLSNYCPYSERISGCRSLHTFISDHLSISLRVYMHLYMYLHQQCVSIPITIPAANRKPSRSALFSEITQRIVLFLADP